MDSNHCPTCGSLLGTWTDDPLLTIDGLSGPTYVGATQIRPIHIKELQDRNTQAELEVGIPEEDRTEFSSLYRDEAETVYDYFVCDKKYIKELRESTEKILDASNLHLRDMLNYAEDGTEIIRYEVRDGVRKRVGRKTTWTDEDIESAEFQVKAIHIEELRCKIPIDVPMHILNRGSGSVDHSQTDIVDIAHLQWTLGYFDWWNMITLWTTQIYGACGVDDNVGFPYMSMWYPEIVTEENGDMFWVDYWYLYTYWVPTPPPGHYVSEWRYYWVARVENPPYFTGGGIIWRGYKYTYWNDGHYAKVTCIPTENNLNIEKYELQELYSDPLLIAETPGYPCQMYSGDSWRYAVPYKKCPKFLEDIVSNLGQSYVMPKEVYAETNIFKHINMPVTAGPSGVAEPHFDQRMLDHTSWGMSDPPGSLGPINPGVWGGVGITGTVQCGNCSVFVPKSWGLGDVTKYRQSTELSWTFEERENEVDFAPYETWWLIDITTEELESPVYDPSTSMYLTKRFSPNYLLAKRDDTKLVAGVIVAKDYKEVSEAIDEDTSEITLPALAVERSVTLTIDGVEWVRVTDTSEYDEEAHIYKVESGKIIFGNGISGYRVKEATTAEITCYVDEIPYTTYYPNGYIVIPKDMSLEHTSAYVYIEYYTAPWNYYLFNNPVTTYEVSYWAKPPTGSLGMGLGAGIDINAITPLPPTRLIA